jgi:hypothetical protein
MITPATKSVASALGRSAKRKYADDPANMIARLNDEKRCRQVLHSFIAPLIAADVPRGGTGRRTLGFLRTIARHLNAYSPATLQRAAQAIIAEGRDAVLPFPEDLVIALAMRLHNLSLPADLKADPALRLSLMPEFKRAQTINTAIQALGVVLAAIGTGTALEKALGDLEAFLIEVEGVDDAT